jgi:hypothetical protein
LGDTITTTGRRTRIRTRITIDFVAIITLFNTIPHNAITTNRIVTITGASITVVAVTIIAILIIEVIRVL